MDQRTRDYIDGEIAVQLEQELLDINMALGDKAKLLADRARAVPAKLDAKIGDLLGRLDGVEKRGDAATSNLAVVVNDIESGVAAAEDAVNQLTNGAPPLDVSETSVSASPASNPQ